MGTTDPAVHARLRFIHSAPAAAPDGLRQVVAEGLSRREKQLPCRFFYDRAGSELFERICSLPEYYLTRTEQAILDARAPEMVEAAGRDLAIVEFGSGSSRKTRLLLEAALRRQSALQYVPIDISADFLHASACALIDEHSGLSITAIAAEYADGMALVPEHDGPRLFVFLGSNIGNFETVEAVAFLRGICARMKPADRLLVGIDLVKDRDVLRTAYNDAAGITAAFNSNLLARINRELGGRFDLQAFAHDAPWVEERSRIEMRLVSTREQRVEIAALDRAFNFQQGEAIHTENSHKYMLAGFAAMCGAAGLAVQEQWTDPRAWFAVLLLRPDAAAALSEGA